MNFTFGIVTSGNEEAHINLKKVIASIHEECGSGEYEILIVGNVKLENIDETLSPFVKIIEFNEEEFPLWITRKKNLIAQNSKYENIVIMHDYYQLMPGWKKGWDNFNVEFDLGMNVINDLRGKRFRDWLLLPASSQFYTKREDIEQNRNVSYSFVEMPDYLHAHSYISGGYFVVKKEFMLKHPLDESLSWGQSEDIRWSNEIRWVTKPKFNVNSEVRTLKPGHCWYQGECTEEFLNILKLKWDSEKQPKFL